MVIMMDLIIYCRFQKEFKYKWVNELAMCHESIKKNP